MSREIPGRDHEDAPHNASTRGRGAFTRRIDCAPLPLPPEVAAATEPHLGHGSGSRAPGEQA
jgi:hypothetical protein